MSTSERLLEDLIEELGQLEAGGIWVDCLKNLIQFVKENRERIDKSKTYEFGEYEEEGDEFRCRIILDTGVIVYGVKEGKPYAKWME